MRMPANNHAKKILVIRHGALGDFMTVLGAMAAIRSHHPNDHVTLLTSRPYVPLAEACGYFDAIYLDNRPSIWRLHEWLGLRQWFRANNFARVYDLQTSRRTSLYYRLFGPEPRPEWCGIAPGCSHFQPDTPKRRTMQNFARLADQLAYAGIKDVPLPDVRWANSDIQHFGLPSSYAVLVPGSSAKGAFKRWPAERFAELAAKLDRDGVTPVVLGGPDDKEVIDIIQATCPSFINLAGRTNHLDIITLSRQARCIIGNDTGPMHLAAATRQPTFFLWSGASNPAVHAPTYPNVFIIQREPLSALSVEEVFSRVRGVEPRTAENGQSKEW